ncbi:tail protein [Bacillus phage CM1]|nr:tail protein [Bacillus phage CM1]
MAKYRATGQTTLFNVNDAVADTKPPANPKEGSLWYNTTDNKFYIYTKGEWKFAAEGMNFNARNLFVGSKDYTGSGWVLQAAYKINESYRGTTVVETISDWGSADYKISDLIERKAVVVGDEVTFSCYARLVGTTETRDVKFFFDGSSKSGTVVGKAGVDWKQFFITFKIEQAIVDNNKGMRFEVDTINGKNIKFQTAGFTLIRGTVPIDWVPAPEDTQDQIDKNNNDINNINLALDALGNDGKLTRFERSLVRGYIADIIGKYLNPTDTLPSLANIDADTYNAGKLYAIRRTARKIGMNLTTSVNYKPMGDAYTALVAYLNTFSPRPWDTSSTAINNIPDRAVWNAKWNDYYNRYALFEIEVQDRQKEYTEQKVGEMKDETIAAISTAGNHATVTYANPVNIKPPIATLGLPEFEGHHTDSFYVNGRNIVAGTQTPKTLTGNNATNQTSNIYTFIGGNSSAISGNGLDFTIAYDWVIEGDNPSGTMYMQGSNPYPLVAPKITFSSSNRSGREIHTLNIGSSIASFVSINMRCDNMVGKLTISNLKIAVGRFPNMPYTPAPEEAWAGSGNRIRPVTNPLFSSGTDLTIWGKFYGDGINNDKFYWNTNGAAIKEKKWIDARLDDKQTWVFSSNGTSTDGVNKFLKSSCSNEYPVLFDDTAPNRSGRVTMGFYEDYLILNCTDYTDSFYQLGSYDMNLHGFAIGDKITFSAEVNADVAGAYLSVWHSDGTNWIENKAGASGIGTAGTWQRLTQTFTIPSNAKGLFCRVYFTRTAASNNTKLRIRKVQLELGTTATPWSRTNLQTFKRVRTDGFAVASPVYASEQVVKYDATILERNGNTPQADQMAMNATTGALYISVNNLDSGWGDTYTPTADEIKAYFLGWKMCNGTFGTNYSGSGSKVWHPLKDTNLSRATTAGNTAPTEPSPSISDKTVNYYQVLYQLVDAVQETVDFDGILELLASDNVVTSYFPQWTPPITKGTIKYGINLATVNQDTRYIIPSMVKRISNAEQKITDDSITATVFNSREYTLALKSKANASDLGNLATKDELGNVAGSVDGKIQDAMDKLDFSPYATKSELKQTATDITAKFSATGGMNLIKNSIGYSDLDFWSLINAYKVDTISNSSLDNLGFGKGFYFKANGQQQGITQDISVIPGQPYTLGWYLNKMTKGADSNYRFWIQVQENNGTSWVTTTQIADNSNTTTNGFEARYMTFTSTKDVVRIRFIGYPQVEAILSGIMLNIGDVALQWTLATGELYNTNIRMNINGIRVSQLDTNGSEIGFTQITPSEFAGYYQNNGTFEKVFYLNGDETVTKKLRATNEITLGNIKILSIQSANSTGWAFVSNKL